MNLRQPPDLPKEPETKAEVETNVFRAFRNSSCPHDFEKTGNDSHKDYFKCKKCGLETQI